jgi:hypothetical protein
VLLFVIASRKIAASISVFLQIAKPIKGRCLNKVRISSCAIMATCALPTAQTA